MKYTPLNDNVLLEMIEKIPELLKCRVVAVGAGLPTINGKPYPMTVKVGDVVIVNRSLLVSIFLDDKPYILMREHKIRLLCKEE